MECGAGGGEQERGKGAGPPTAACSEPPPQVLRGPGCGKGPLGVASALLSGGAPHLVHIEG